jgi:tetratricopeptide (TPR) repeat protein
MLSKKFPLVVFLFLSVLSVRGQKIDSLEALLPGATGAARADVLYALAYEYIEVDNGMAKRLSGQGYQIAKDLNDSLLIVRTGRVFGSALRRTGSLDSALLIYGNVVQIARKKHFRDELNTLLNSFGLAYSLTAQYDKALEQYLETLSIRKEKKDTASVSIVLNNIGVVHYKLKDYGRAIEYFKNSLALKNKVGDQYDIETLLVNIGCAYAYKNDSALAMQYIERGLNVCERKECSSTLFLNAYVGLGFNYFNQGKFYQAEQSFLKGRDFATSADDTRFHLDCIDYLSQIYLKRNQVDKAIRYLNDAEKLIEKTSTFNLEATKIYLRFFEAYSIKRDYPRIAHYQAKYIGSRENIFNEELTTSLMKIDANYLERENLAKISVQNQMITLKEEIIEEQRLLIIFAGSVVMGLFVLAGILLMVYKQKKQMNLVLDEKVNDRTRALKQSHESLILATREKKMLVVRTSEDIRSSLATIKGLCAVGLQDISDSNAKHYVIKMKSASEQLSFVLQDLYTVGSTR